MTGAEWAVETAELEHAAPRARLRAREHLQRRVRLGEPLGAPSTSRSSPRSSALHRRREAKGTRSATVLAATSTSPASAIAMWILQLVAHQAGRGLRQPHLIAA